MTADRDTLTIYRVGFGFAESLTFWDWATDVIQDDEEALRIGAWLADKPNDLYPWNEGDEPTFYEEFSLVDTFNGAQALRIQMDDYRIAWKISEPS